MKKTFLLSLAMMLAVATQAQVLMTEYFSAPQTKQPSDVGYYEFINTQDGDEREVADGRLHFYNSDATVGQNWQRAIKFRNLLIHENTSYRVKFKLMGSNTYYSVDDDAEVSTNARFALMQGGENLDMGFLTPVGGEQQLMDISRFQTPEEGRGYHTYTGMFYYTTDAAQKAWYAEQNPTKDELPATYFLTLNVYNPGDFYIDDVVVEQSNIAGVTFRDDVIRVDFGYDINYKALLAGKSRLLMPNDCVKVMLDGQEVNVLTVELLSDGSFYIFLDDQYPDGEDNSVVVSFTNPSDPAYELYYAEGRTPGGVVMNFADEVAVYDLDMPDVYSFAFVTPTLLEADPEDGSFNLPLNQKEFRFTFDKDVDCSLIEGRLDDERLVASPATGLSRTVTFSRSGADLSAGEYTLKLTKIYPEVMLAPDVFGEESLTLTFGPVNADPNDTVRVVMTDGFEEAGAGGYPDKWIVMSDGNLRTSASDGWGSGSRLMDGFSGAFTVGMYLCGRNGNEGYAFYGAKEAAEDKFHLGAGKYQMTFNAATWDNTAVHAVRVQVCDEMDRVVVEQTSALNSHLDNNNKDASNLEKFELNFRAATEGNYVLKFWGLSAVDGTNGGWGDAIMFGNLQVKYMPAAAGVEETNLLLTALADAKKALEEISDERYLGVDYDALKAMIEAYDGKAMVFTAPSQFKNAAADLNAATSALKNHKSLCDTYDPLVDNAKYARDQRIDTKYERHESFAAIEAAIAKYEGRVLTDNAELTEAITELQNTTDAVLNVVRVVENYTASMVEALSTLELLGTSDEALIAEVNDLLTDDPSVKRKVKRALYNVINGLLANPNNTVFATKIDDVTLEEYVDSLNLSVFIDNPELYYTSWDDKAPASVTDKPMPSSENLPGWTISNVEKGWEFAYHYPWGASTQYAYNAATCPNANGMIAAWTSGFDIEQTVENLPAGRYSLYVGIGERGGNESPTSYIFANDAQQVVPVIAGSVEPADNCVINDILVTDGTLKVGAHVDKADHVFLNCFHLFMKAAAEGYTYVDGIADVAGEALVSRTETYDLSGRRADHARGVVIVKKTYSDGRVKTAKIVK